MNDFEKAINEIDGSSDAGECVIEWLRGNKTATVTFPNNTKYKNRIKQLEAEYPQEVQICKENKDGSIVAHIPVSYIKINRSKRELTEEQRKELADRLKQIRKTAAG